MREKPSHRWGIALFITFGVALLGADAAEEPPAAPKGDVAGKTASAPVSPWIRFDRKVVFTMALGGDVATNSKIAVALATRLHDNGKHDLGPVRGALIVPQGQWTLGEYLQQCARDANTLGAFIVLPPASANSVDNYIVLLRNKTEVTLSFMVARCDHAEAATGSASAGAAGPKPVNPGDNTAVVWASFAEHGVTGRSQIEFFPLAILTSAYLALSPQRTNQTTTTTVFPVPSPIPAGGARSNVQTVNSTVLNAQGNATLQQGVLTAFSATGGPGGTIGATGSPEKQTYHAADDALGQVVIKQLNTECTGHRDAGAADPFHVFCAW